MSRNRSVVLVLVALVVLVVGGGVFAFSQIGPFDGAESARGGASTGARGLNAKIMDLDAATEPERRPDVGTPPPATRLSPGGTVSTSSGGGAARSGGGAAAAPEVAPAACTASLLQSILGLGVTLLGGRSSC